MPRIELDSLIGNMTPEQKILTSWFYSQFDNRSAVNRRIINVEPITLIIAVGGECSVYAATKLYLCLSFVTDAPNAGAGNVLTNVFYNEANAAFFTLSFACYYYDTVNLTFKGQMQSHELKNFYFSRLVATGFAFIKFIGYRITLV
jgi:hypothetical protein